MQAKRFLAQYKGLQYLLKLLKKGVKSMGAQHGWGVRVSEGPFRHSGKGVIGSDAGSQSRFLPYTCGMAGGVIIWIINKNYKR